MPRADKPHPDQLLCERCGYPLEGLDTELPCPECGKPIAESLPSRRTGSAWQRRSGLVSWFATNWTTVRHPLKRWDEVQVSRELWLLLLNALAVGVPFAFFYGQTLDDGGRASSVHVLWSVWVFSCPFGAVIVGLSMIEGLGLRVLGARNKWRISKDVSGAIIAHASIGWLLAAPVMAVEYAYFRSLTMPAALAWVNAPWWWMALAYAAAPLAGLLGFEVLAWLGWRRMKFANRTRANPIKGV